MSHSHNRRSRFDVTGEDLHDAGLDPEQYMTLNQAAHVLGCSAKRVRQLMEDGSLPTIMTPHGVTMIDKQAVMQHSNDYVPDNQKKVAECLDCHTLFERVRYSSGADPDKSKRVYRDGDYCPACRKKRKNEEDTSLVVVSKYTPHVNQVCIHESKARYRIISAGARFGKDRSCINEFVRLFGYMLNEDWRGDDMVPRVHGFLVAPTFRLTRQLWREVKQFFPKEWIEQIYEGDKRITTIMGGEIEVASADNPDSLVSVGLDIVQITEAPRIPNLEEVWANLAGRVNSPHRGPGGNGGVILANGTPRGKGMWFDLYRMGQKDDPNYDPAYESWKFTTYDNPHVNKVEIDRLAKVLPSRIFRMEYLAEWIEEADQVFTHVGECATYKGPQEPEVGETYQVAWDPAKSVDFSACGVRNSKGETVEFHQWTGIPWKAQLERVSALSRKYNFAPVRMDATGVGQTLPEMLDRLGVQVEPIVFNNSIKEDMVNHLAFLMEQEAISYPDDHRLTSELRDFKYTISERGVIRYAAPRGDNHHDDLVTMMMLLYSDYNQAEATMPFMGILTGVSIGGGRRSSSLRH